MELDADAIDRRFEEASRQPAPSLDELLENDQPPEHSEDEIALKFSELYADTLRYVARWGKWFRWNGKVWREDTTLSVYDDVRKMCRTTSIAADIRSAMKIATAKTIAAVEKMARADRRHAATHEQWDGDPWLLNTPSGVVDLRTGRNGPHDASLYMTKMTAVGPSDAGCPTWLKFLERVLHKDADLVEFLQRVFGYALTGITSEHALFFLYGTGRNGKGTAVNTVERILASYACVAGMETFTASKHDRHLTELARLQGARLVTSQETEEGRAWAESRIKALTGGDPITANFMRMDHFTFVPLFKLIIAGNHKPAIKNLDEAMRARINLIPFTVTIPREERDPDLSAKLEAEWPGILHWMIQGCLAWQQKRLVQPQAVLDATAEYFSEQDTFKRWLEECCIMDRTLHSGSTPLFESWKAFALQQNESPGTATAFGLKLSGIASLEKKALPNGNKGFKGIGLAVTQDDGSARRYGDDR